MTAAGSAGHELGEGRAPANAEFVLPGGELSEIELWFVRQVGVQAL